MTITATLTLRFGSPGYIADPYWPEREELINIQKESGMNRSRSEEKRQSALREYLSVKAITIDQYTELGRLASRPFYTLPPTNGQIGEIVIPQHQVKGCLVNACDVAPKTARLGRPEQIHTLFRVSPLVTGRREADGVYKRFVVVTGGGGPGMKLSNQRALRTNPYIENFEAVGAIEWKEESFDESKLSAFLAYAGREIGIGACRPMGYGRFEPELTLSH